MKLLITFDDYFDDKDPNRVSVIKVIKDIYAMLSDPNINEKDVFYTIADLMFLPIMDRDGELEDICQQAGVLELPDHHIQDKKRRIKQFDESIEQLR